VDTTPPLLPPPYAPPPPPGAYPLAPYGAPGYAAPPRPFRDALKWHLAGGVYHVGVATAKVALVVGGVVLLAKAWTRAVAWWRARVARAEDRGIEARDVTPADREAGSGGGLIGLGRVDVGGSPLPQQETRETTIRETTIREERPRFVYPDAIDARPAPTKRTGRRARA
jgi:hypothetical protein